MSFAFLPLYTGDYLRDTQHLSCSEHGIFVKLLMHCWDQRGPVPLDERKQCGIVNARSADEIEALRRVLSEFFVRCDDGWYNSRMQRELERANAISEKRAACGQLGGRPRKSSGRKGLPVDSNLLISKAEKPIAKQEQAIAKQVPQTPTPTTTPTTTPRSTPKSSRFEIFWSVYPHYPNRSSKAKSWDRWAKMNLDSIAADVMRALQACIAIPNWTKNGREFVCAAEVWLNKRLWEQELVSLADRLIESITADPRFADMKP